VTTGGRLPRRRASRGVFGGGLPEVAAIGRRGPVVGSVAWLAWVGSVEFDGGGAPVAQQNWFMDPPEGRAPTGCSGVVRWSWRSRCSDRAERRGRDEGRWRCRRTTAGAPMSGTVSRTGAVPRSAARRR
jgi:hypothetical protein